MQKLWIKTKQIVIFFTLRVMVIWFNAEIIFALICFAVRVSNK